MPAPVVSDDKRGWPLLAVLFWIGVALAPVAALLLLFADGNGPLRLAAVLAILAVVLIGLSIALREGGGQARADELLDELEQVRQQLRAEIAAVARGGHQAVEIAHRVQESLAALRHRIDSGQPVSVASPAGAPGRARVPSAGFDAPDEGHFAAGVEADPSGRFAGPADQDRFAGAAEEGHRGRFAVPDAGRARIPRQREEEPEPVRRAQSSPRPAPTPQGGHGSASVPQGGHGSASVPQGGHGSASVPQGGYGSAPRSEGRPAAPGPEAPRPLGVVRHTETVHVTTRHTIVDGSAADPGAANRYGGGYPGHWSAEDRGHTGHWPTAPEERAPAAHWSAPDDRGWSEPGPEQGDRSWAGYAEHDDRSWERPAPERTWTAPATGWDGPPAGQPDQDGSTPSDDDGAYWTQLRSGGRWASVRDDEHGRELRVGERRASVHADGAGAELRVEDRWAAVRRSEPRAEHPERDGWSAPAWAEPEAVPALPAGGVPVPESWRPAAGQRGHQLEGGWSGGSATHRQEEPEPVRRARQQYPDEQRYGYPPQGDVPRAGGARSADSWR